MIVLFQSGEASTVEGNKHTHYFPKTILRAPHSSKIELQVLANASFQLVCGSVLSLFNETAGFDFGNAVVCIVLIGSEAATRVVPCKKVLLEISQNSLENTCARVSFLI